MLNIFKFILINSACNKIQLYIKLYLQKQNDLVHQFARMMCDFLTELLDVFRNDVDLRANPQWAQRQEGLDAAGELDTINVHVVAAQILGWKRSGAPFYWHW